MICWDDWIPWLRSVAVRLNVSMMDDLVQEGLIAMWEAERVHDPARGPLIPWIKLSAVYRMRHVLQAQMTRKGRRGDTPQWSLRHIPVGNDEYLDTAVTVDLDAAQLAYHHEDLRDAIRELAPRQREYVYMRFWRQASGEEMREHFGYDPGALWSSPVNGARNKLRNRLAHMR